MGKTGYITSLVIFAAVGASAQPVARVANADSSAYESTAYKQSQPEPIPVPNNASDLSFAVKIVPGASKKLNFEVVSPQSGYAEVTLLNSRGDQMFILHKGRVQAGTNIFRLDSAKVRPGMYYVVSKYEGGLQVADKVTLYK